MNNIYVKLYTPSVSFAEQLPRGGSHFFQRNKAAHPHTKLAAATKVSEHAAGSAAHRVSAVSEHAHRRRWAAQRGRGGDKERRFQKRRTLRGGA